MKLDLGYEQPFFSHDLADAMANGQQETRHIRLLTSVRETFSSLFMQRLLFNDLLRDNHVFSET